MYTSAKAFTNTYACENVCVCMRVRACVRVRLCVYVSVFFSHAKVKTYACSKKRMYTHTVLRSDFAWVTLPRGAPRVMQLIPHGPYEEIRFPSQVMPAPLKAFREHVRTLISTPQRKKWKLLSITCTRTQINTTITQTQTHTQTHTQYMQSMQPYFFSPFIFVNQVPHVRKRIINKIVLI